MLSQGYSVNTEEACYLFITKAISWFIYTQKTYTYPPTPHFVVFISEKLYFFFLYLSSHFYCNDDLTEIIVVSLCTSLYQNMASPLAFISRLKLGFKAKYMAF